MSDYLELGSLTGTRLQGKKIDNKPFIYFQGL